MNQAQAQLADMRTAIRLGESTLAQMGEYDLIVMDDGRHVDRADIEAEIQRVMDALARMAFEQKVTAQQPAL